MIEGLEFRLASFMELLALSLAAYPLRVAFTIVATLVCFGLCCYFIYHRQVRRAFWVIAALIISNILFSYGEDTVHHVFRIQTLADQIRQGYAGALFTDPASGSAYPVFVYYSFLPYLLPVLINLMGMPALLAFKFALGIQYLVFAFGLRALIRRYSATQARRPDDEYLLAILFATSTYVYSLWIGRAALGELWAYSLLPWALNSFLDPRQSKTLFLVLFLQICAHPLVFVHGFAGTILVALGLSSERRADMLKRGAVAAATALLVATPFWLPQFIWLHAIVGNAILPEQLADSFLSIRELFNPLNERNIGLALPLCLGLMIVLHRGQLTRQTWLLVTAFAALILLQTRALSAFTVQIPVIDQSQFIWRLMFPAALVAFGALLSGWVRVGMAPKALRALAALSVAFMTLIQIGHAPGSVLNTAGLTFDALGYTQRGSYVSYYDEANVWGLTLFGPDYSLLPENCDALRTGAVQSVSYRDVRVGISATEPYVAIANGPVGLVTYRANDSEIQRERCEQTLLLGPVAYGTQVTVSEMVLDVLQIVRISILLTVCGAFLFFAVATNKHREI